ncbi:carbohydrate ABC transporter permease [Dehalococcoidia bacterium]|nr:carbohydrate ABC transporter permease [Dehalococcoidia bacterium]
MKNKKRVQNENYNNNTCLQLTTLKRERFKEGLLKFTLYAFLIITGLPIVIGYSWLIVNSFAETMTWGLVPTGFTFENWRFLWERPSPYYPELWRTTWNTLVLAIGTTAIVLLTSAPSAYAISRMKFTGRNFLLAFTLILHAFPGIALLIATYYVLRVLDALNLVGVAFATAALFMPFAVWVLKGHFDVVPWDIEMSALVDGASRFQVWYKIMLPQVKRGLAAVAIFAFFTGWSQYIFVITFIHDRASWTLTSYVNAIIGDFRFLDYGLLSAVALFYIAPILLVSIFLQKYLTQMGAGGMKGGS